VQTRNVETKTKIFISYSRKDMTFADKLEAALKARGFEVLIDREEIYAFEDWWKRIETLIGSADTVIFILSPAAVKSRVALKEVNYAASLNKRFAPIVYRRVEVSAVPEQLRRLNFIFFDEPAKFDASADALALALQTDIGWIRQHTEYGEAERRWSVAGRPSGLLLHSPTLEIAEYWIASRPRAAPEPTKEIQAFVAASRRGARSAQRLRRLAQASMFTLLVGIILVLVGWINQEYIKTQWRWYTITRPYMVSRVRPYVLRAAEEQALKPGDSFRECAREQGQDDCPVMVVVPAGSFIMGSSTTEKGHNANESPQHNVTIAKAFAVSKFEVTFDEWDVCVVYGDCPSISDSNVGRERQPAFNVSWNKAQRYVAWLAEMTGKSYRLLTEAEYEYATRAGTQTVYPWGDDIGTNKANCDGCGSQWDGRQSAPVGSFAPNRFGLFDMVGNVYQWVEDCYHPSYEVETPQGEEYAPVDGSAWISGQCTGRVARGGAWRAPPEELRAAYRRPFSADAQGGEHGFRVARTLAR
jgi:formylglycine-generating enzyme required for sulfatase activity